MKNKQSKCRPRYITGQSFSKKGTYVDIDMKTKFAWYRWNWTRAWSVSKTSSALPKIDWAIKRRVLSDEDKEAQQMIRAIFGPK